MKCPNCGSWNKASLPRCMRCGPPLPPPPDAEPAWKSELKDDKGREYIRVDESGEVETTPDSRDQLAQEMAELKQRKATGASRQRALRAESARRGSAPSGMTIRTHRSVNTFWNVEDDPSSTVRFVPPEKPVQQEGAGTHRDAGVTYDGFDETRSYDPLWSQQEMSSTYQLPRDTRLTKLPSRRRGLRHVIRFLAVLLMLSVTGLAVFFGIAFFQQRQATVKDANAAIVTASIRNDLAAHTIMIPGEDGQQIYIRELHTSYIVTGGFATVQVEDHFWYDDYEGNLGETMEVTLTPFLKSASGQQTPMDPITYEISIPLSPITLDSPDSTYQEVSTAMYTLSFTVRPGSTITINGEDYSDVVDADTGSVSINATIQPIGDNVFNVVVRSQYCRENTMTVILHRAKQEIPLDLAADTYTSTNSEKILISCTTLPGATVEVLSPHTDLNITDVDTTGEFSFYAVFDQIGDNTITVTASMPGKQTSVLNYVVYYVPPASEYTMKAWSLENGGYSELLNNISIRTANRQIYLAAGTITSIISDKPQMAIVDTGTDGKEQLLMVENYSKTTWKVGDWYRLYGDVAGTYDSIPWLQVRYTYSKGEY